MPTYFQCEPRAAESMAEWGAAASSQAGRPSYRMPRGDQQGDRTSFGISALEDAARTIAETEEIGVFHEPSRLDPPDTRHLTRIWQVPLRSTSSTLRGNN